MTDALTRALAQRAAQLGIPRPAPMRPATPAPADPFTARREAHGYTRPLTETARILALPTVPQDAPVHDLTAELALPGGTLKLRPIQCRALAAIRAHRGLLGVIGVGHGKSLISLLAGTVLGAKLALILAPASTVSQLRRTLAEARGHFRIPDTRILSYDTLSRPDGTRMLEDYLADLPDHAVVLVADEAHRLKRKESARTKRVVRFLQAHPGIAFVALSGTMTSKALADFAHLSAMALRDASPVPRDRGHLAAWSECLDVGGRPAHEQWQVLDPLVQRYAGQSVFSYRGAKRTATARAAFRERLATAPGVVTTAEGSIGCSLRLIALSLPVPEAVKAALRGADAGEDPAGEPIPDDATAWRVRRHLSQGFYYVWQWPGEPDLEWLEAKRAWARYVRAELEHHAHEGYDSPFLVASRVERELAAGRTGRLHRVWERWRAVKDRPAPPTVPVWIDRYQIAHAAAWAGAQKRPVILWYDSLAVEDALREQGLPVYGAGAEIPRHAHTCAMSIQAHGVGKNLQAWDTMLVLSPPSSGQAWEQLLGRLHRQGQEADEVECYIYQHTEAFRLAVKAAVEDARYIQSTTGNAQKLRYADFDGF